MRRTVYYNEDPTFSGLILYHVRSVSSLFFWNLTEVAGGAEEGLGSLPRASVANTFGGRDDWRVGPETTFLQGRRPVSRRAQRRFAAVALARQQPELALETAGIRNLRPMFARL
jgi:hypothetical protein